MVATADSPKRAWLLNLDAELELAAPQGYTPNRAVLSFIEQHQPKLAGLTRGDRVLANEPGASNQARGLLGLAWCPTPYALKRLQRAGANLPKAPSLGCLQRVNHRKFCTELGQTLPGAQFFEDPDALLRFLEPRLEQPWLIKRGYGFAGRGQRRTRRILDADDQRWVVDSFAQGGVQVEPFLEIVMETALHGMINEGDGIRLGQLCVQECDTQRRWQRSKLCTPTEIGARWTAQLHEEAQLCAQALKEAGYFGPFGVDSYLYRDSAGRLRLNPRSEINARFTMGFEVGLADAILPRPTTQTEAR